MATDPLEHIAARNRAAELRRPEQNWLGRLVSDAGRHVANGMDRVSAVVSNDRALFTRHSAVGAMRGAVYGGIAAIVALAAFPALIPAAFAVFGGAAAVGAVSMSIYDSTTALEEKWTRDKRSTADRLAEWAGATPSKYREARITPSENLGEELRKAGYDKMLVTKAEEAQAQAPQSFQERLKQETRGPVTLKR